MSWFDIIKKRIEISGGNLRQETINISQFAHKETSPDDPSYRLVQRYIGHEFLDEFTSNIIDDTSQNKKMGLKKVICDINQEINIGDYIVFKNKSGTMDYWIVTYVEDNDVVKTATMAQCQYLLKWIDKVSFEILEYHVVLLSKNSYSSGVWSNTFAQYVDSEISLVLPFVDDIKRIVRDDRFLISTNQYNPDSFVISRIQNSINPGLVNYVLQEDEPSPVYDDYENMIADRWKYENTYEIIVLNGVNFNVGLMQNSQLQVRVQGFNQLMNVTTIVDEPVLLYKSVNENVLKIFDDGTIQPIAIGSTFIDIFLMSNTSDKATIVTQKRIEVTVENAVVVENNVVIHGSSTIFFDARQTYTATLLKNGLEVPETFEFTLLNSVGNPLSNKVAKFITVQPSTCQIQAFDYMENITLVTKSLSTGLEDSIIITIRDIL